MAEVATAVDAKEVYTLSAEERQQGWRQFTTSNYAERYWSGSGGSGSPELGIRQREQLLVFRNVRPLREVVVVVRLDGV